MNDAVKGFESPGMQSIGIGSHLQGALTIRKPKLAGSAVVMFTAVFDGSVDYPSGWTARILVFHPGKLFRGIAAIFRHMRQYECRVLDDILDFVHIHPYTKYTASPFALIQFTALERFRPKHPWINTINYRILGMGHVWIVPFQWWIIASKTTIFF